MKQNLTLAWLSVFLILSFSVCAQEIQIMNISFNISKINVNWTQANLPNKTIIYDNNNNPWELNISTQQGYYRIQILNGTIHFDDGTQSYDGAKLYLIDRNNSYRLTTESEINLEYAPFNYVLTSGLEPRRQYGFMYINKSKSGPGNITNVFSMYPTAAYNGQQAACTANILDEWYTPSEIIAIRPSCLLLTTSTYQNFNSIYFGLWSDTNSDGYEDSYILNISVTNVMNASVANYLPNGTIYTNYSEVCLNDYGWVDVPLYSSYTDYENDTIMYATDQVDWLLREEMLSEDFYDHENNAMDFGLWSRGNLILDESTCYPLGNFCVTVDCLRIACSDNWLTFGSISGNTMLVVSEGASPFTYTLNESADYQVSYYNLFGIKNDTVINVYAKDTNDNRILNLTFNKTVDSELKISVNGQEEYSGIFPNFNNRYENYFDMTLMFKPETNYIGILIASLEQDFLQMNLTQEYDNFVSIAYDGSGSNNIWVMDYLTVKSWDHIAVPEFSESLITPVRIRSSGFMYIRTLVSDYNHYQIPSYATNDLPIMVYAVNNPQCEVIEGQLGTNTTEINQSIDNPIVVINDLIHDPFNDYLDAIGMRTKGEYLLWFVWLIVFVGIIIFEYRNGGGISFTAPLAISSMGIMVISLIFGFTGTGVVSFIALAFALALPLAKHYMGDQ